MREAIFALQGTDNSGQNSVPVLETVLTICTTRLRGQLHTILEDMDRYSNSCLEELEAFMTLIAAVFSGGSAIRRRKEALEEVVQRIYRNNN
ncbi:hypothetical protein Tco_0375850 [Tanacetum coccineum]